MGGLSLGYVGADRQALIHKGMGSEGLEWAKGRDGGGVDT